MRKYKKLKEILGKECHKPKEYLMRMTVPDARMNYRVRMHMVDLLSNMKGKAKDGVLVCRGCQEEGTEESQSHMIACKAYEHLRLGLNMERDLDLVKFYQEVLKTRSKKEL